MKIPNKFNGYMTDGRRLYPDPVTSAIMAETLAASAAPVAAATTTAGLTAAAEAAAATAAADAAASAVLPGITAEALPGVLSSAAPELSAAAPGITQGIGGIQAMSPEITANLGQAAAEATAKEAAMNVAQTGGQGLMEGADAVNQIGRDQALEAINNYKPFDRSAYPEFEKLASKDGTQLVERAAAQPNPYDLTSKAVPDVAGQRVPLPESVNQMSGGKGLTFNNTGQGFSSAPQNLYQTAAEGAPKPGLGFEGIAQNISKFPWDQPESQPSKMDSLRNGFSKASKWVEDNPFKAGAGLVLAGQYMNQPEQQGDGEKPYKSSVDMSHFQRSEPQQQDFNRSYDWQNYASGGDVTEDDNETKLVKLAKKSGKGLSNAYEDMNKQRQQELAKVKSLGDSFNEGIIPRSRTQLLTSPTKAAEIEFAALAKKNKVPVVKPAKTNLGDSEDYMDTPLDSVAAANGGLMQHYAMGGQTAGPEVPMPNRLPMEQASIDQSIGNNNGFPMANVRQSAYSSPISRPLAQPVIGGNMAGDAGVDTYTGEQTFAAGGISYGLGGYSDGGRLLKGPGDGVSDSIPAVIGHKQPARLADGEFVIPARIVSELGNGSTEAGARKLYAMMERIQKQRSKTVGKGKVAVNSKSDKHLPA